MGEMVTMNDLDWPMLSYYVIYYKTFRNVMQRTEKEALILVYIIYNYTICPDEVQYLLPQKGYFTCPQHAMVKGALVYRPILCILSDSGGKIILFWNWTRPPVWVEPARSAEPCCPPIIYTHTNTRHILLTAIC